MTDFQDWQSEAQVAVKIGTTDLTGTGLAKDATVTGVSKTTDIAALHATGKTIAAEVGTTDLTATGLNKEATQATLSKTTDIAALHAAGKTIAADVGATDLTATGLNKEATQTTLSKTTDIAALHAAGHTVANEISTTGTPLLRQNNVIASNTAQTVAGGATATLLATTAFSQPAVQVFLNLKMPANSGTIPFARLRLNWVNSNTGITLATRDFVGACGNNASIPHNLLAPARADELQVQLLNGDPAITITYDFVIIGITHFVVDDDWTATGQQNVNGFTNGGYGGNTGTFFSTNPSIAPSSTITRLVMAAGRKCSIVVNNDVAGGNGNNLEVIISDPTGLYNLANTGADVFYIQTGIVAGGDRIDEIVLPPGPTLITLTNLQGVNTITPGVVMQYEKITT